jgi:hypothetical protein
MAGPSSCLGIAHAAGNLDMGTSIDDFHDGTSSAVTLPSYLGSENSHYEMALYMDHSEFLHK